MFCPNSRNQFLTILREIRMSCDYPPLILSYKILRAIAINCPSLDRQKIHSFLCSTVFRQALAKYPQSITTRAFSGDEHLDSITELCRILHANNLVHDHTAFFLAVTPGMVADWYTLNQLDNSPYNILDVLFRLFLLTEDILGTDEVYNRNPFEYLVSLQHYFPAFHLDALEKLWYATFHSSYHVPDYQSERIKTAKKLYFAKGKSQIDLLNNYCLEYRDIGQQPIIYSKLSLAECNKVTPSRIPKDDEINYHTAPNMLTMDCPAKVLAELYYKGHCDPVVECTLLLNNYLNRLSYAQRPLVINPSPYFLDVYTHYDCTLPPLTVVVPSRKQGLTLSQQYHNIIFWSVDELLAQPVEADLVLLISPSTGKDKPTISTLLRCFIPTPNCELVAYISEKSVTNENTSILLALNHKSMQVNQLINVPTELINAAPKKKLIITATASSTHKSYSNDVVPLYHCIPNESGNYVFVAPDPIMIPLTSLYRTHTLKQALGESIPHKDNIKRRGKATHYMWSTEICIAYTMHDGSTPTNTYFRAKAMILKTDDHDPDKRSNGIPNTQTEKGLRARTEDELMQRIIELPLRPNLYKPILEDILRVYRHTPERLSIKTIWFCLRPILSKNRYYDDDLAMMLFCAKDQSVANLLFTARYEDYQSAITATLGTDKVPLKYWTLLQMIAVTGIKYGFLDRNPLAPYWPIIEIESMHRTYNTQDALRKWCFTETEIDRMVTPLIAFDNSVPQLERMYATDSHALLKMYALFTLIRKSELLALDFGDIVFLPNGGAQALITKYVKPDGGVTEYTTTGKERHRRRKVALPPLLAHCTLERQMFLQHRFDLDSATMHTYPLFLAQEPLYKKAKIRRCTHKTALALYTELLQSANVPDIKISLLEGEHAQLVDLGLSRKTESVFRNHLRICGSIYGLEDGEIAYSAGTLPNETIDAHYIGYDAPQNQIATSAKLHRMTAKYLDRIVQSRVPQMKKTQQICESHHHLTFTAGVDQRMTSQLEIIPDTLSPSAGYRIKIRSTHGHQINVSMIHEEVNNDQL